MKEAFEIIYADGTVVAGHTAAQYRAASNEGIQFVIVRYKTGVIIKHKCLSEYEYNGVMKQGDWTEDSNFNELKQKLGSISKLMFSEDLIILMRWEIRQRERQKRS